MKNRPIVVSLIRSSLLLALLAQLSYGETDRPAERESLRRAARRRVDAAREAAERRVRGDTQLRVQLPARGDEDGDGVLNQNDWCLHTRRSDDGSFDVDADGCSPWQRDSDDDSVPDALDRCPGTPRRGRYGAGTLVDEKGCEIWVWRDGGYTAARAPVQESVWESPDSALAAQDGFGQGAGEQQDATSTPPPADSGRSRYDILLQSATGAVGWVMHPPDADRALRTGLICAAAAGLIGFAAAFAKYRIEKQPLDETTEKRILRKIIR